jgi:hypothetical protein
VPGALPGLGWLAFWEGNEEEANRLFADSLPRFEKWEIDCRPRGVSTGWRSWLPAAL